MSPPVGRGLQATLRNFPFWHARWPGGREGSGDDGAGARAGDSGHETGRRGGHGPPPGAPPRGPAAARAARRARRRRRGSAPRRGRPRAGARAAARPAPAPGRRRARRDLRRPPGQRRRGGPYGGRARVPGPRGHRTRPGRTAVVVLRRTRRRSGHRGARRPRPRRPRRRTRPRVRHRHRHLCPLPRHRRRPPPAAHTGSARRGAYGGRGVARLRDARHGQPLGRDDRPRGGRRPRTACVGT